MNDDRDRASAADGLEDARAQGRADGEAFDRMLREVETRDREKRITELAWKGLGGDRRWSSPSDSAQRLRLEARIDELARYIRTIESSSAWRAIQSIRRVFGREW